MIEDFTAKLAHALKVANLSRTRLAKLIGVDKSVASRWVSGATRPSDANLDALTKGLNEALPDLKLSDWLRPLDEFTRRVGNPGAADPEQPESDKSVDALPLPDKPSIAVLPFVNMSGDADQEFFGDGIAEDVLTSLSKLGWLFVISRNSSFTYKGKAVDVRQVSRELGVRYVLEGSVRKAGNRVRITGQLVDAVSGAHVWAERFDRDLTDIFAVQDEIVGAVIAAISRVIVDTERRRAARKPPQDLGVWEAYQRGLWHYAKFQLEDLQAARSFFQQVIARDPDFGAAYVGLALTHTAEGAHFLTISYTDAVKLAQPLVLKALALDGNNASALVLLAYCHFVQGNSAQALRDVEQTLKLDPNSADGHALRGLILSQIDKTDEGQEALRMALRLGPQDPRRASWRMYIASAQYGDEEYDKALATAEQVAREFPTFPPVYRWMAACLGQLGRKAEAAAALKTLLDLAPGNIDVFLNSRPAWMSPDRHRLMLEGLKKAGWKA